MNDTTTAVVVAEDWGSEDVSNRDIQIPTINLMHDISQLVKDKKADAGSIVSSQMNELLAKEGESFEIIAFKSFREWLVNEVDNRGKKVNFIGKFPVTPENENWAKEAIMDGKAVERTYCLNFFCVLPKELNGLPHIVSFRKSGLRVGKGLATHFKTSSMAKTPPAGRVFKLGAKQNTYQGNTFWVFDLQPSRAATPEEIAVAKQWYLALQNASVNVAAEPTSSEEAPF